MLETDVLVVNKRGIRHAQRLVKPAFKGLMEIVEETRVIHHTRVVNIAKTHGELGGVHHGPPIRLSAREFFCRPVNPWLPVKAARPPWPRKQSHSR